MGLGRFLSWFFFVSSSSFSTILVEIIDSEIDGASLNTLRIGRYYMDTDAGGKKHLLFVSNYIGRPIPFSYSYQRIQVLSKSLNIYICSTYREIVCRQIVNKWYNEFRYIFIISIMHLDVFIVNFRYIYCALRYIHCMHDINHGIPSQ